MKKNIILFFIGVFFSNVSLGKQNILQGPFSIDKNNKIMFTMQNDTISFIQEKNGKQLVIDSYQEGNDYPFADNEVIGDQPDISSVFFMNIKNEKNIVVLLTACNSNSQGVCWGGTETFFYTYDSGKIALNKSIRKDSNLASNNCLTDAASVKAYINKKYNNIEPTHMAKNWWHDCGFDDN